MKSRYSTLRSILICCATACMASCADTPVAQQEGTAPPDLYGRWRYSMVDMKTSDSTNVRICIAGYLDLHEDDTWDQDLRIGGEMISSGPGKFTATEGVLELQKRNGTVQRWDYSYHRFDDGSGAMTLAGLGPDGTTYYRYILDRSR